MAKSNIADISVTDINIERYESVYEMDSFDFSM